MDPSSLWQSAKHGNTRPHPHAMMMRASLGHTVGALNTELDDSTAIIEYTARACQSGAHMGVITEPLVYVTSIASYDPTHTLSASQVTAMDALMESFDVVSTTLDHSTLPTFPRAHNESLTVNVLYKTNARVLMLLPWLHIGGADV